MSFDIPEYTGNVTALGTTRLLEAIREEGCRRGSTSFAVRDVRHEPRCPHVGAEPVLPGFPYAGAKVYGYWMAVNYREAYGVFCTNGTLFNHESERRDETFVTRKITRGLARILAGRSDAIYLGRLDSRRDWGHATDYVQAMWLMMQAEEPEHYVIATGEAHSVRDFLDEAFGFFGLDWEPYVRQNPRYFRPVDPPILVGDASKAWDRLGWKPTVSFSELVRSMVDELDAAVSTAQPRGPPRSSDERALVWPDRGGHGGSGFLGSHVVQRLEGAGASVFVSA